MADSGPHAPQQDFVYIDLDDPSPWWASMVGVVAVALIVAVLVAPWVIDWEEDSTSQAAGGTNQGSSSLCRPISTGLPSFLNPSVASWNRFCEWFLEPTTDSP